MPASFFNRQNLFSNQRLNLGFLEQRHATVLSRGLKKPACRDRLRWGLKWGALLEGGELVWAVDGWAGGCYKAEFWLGRTVLLWHQGVQKHSEQCGVGILSSITVSRLSSRNYFLGWFVCLFVSFLNSETQVPLLLRLQPIVFSSLRSLTWVAACPATF